MMVDLEILLVFEEEILEVLNELEQTTSLKYALRSLHTVSNSSKLVELSTLTEAANQLSKSIEISGELNSYEIKNFTMEARRLIQGAVRYAELVSPETEPKPTWWKFW